MSKMQSKSSTSTANYISIFLLTMVALSGTLYLIFYSINKPPFDLELSMDFATKKAVQCVSQELINGNIPHEVVSFDEKEWIVLRVIEDKRGLQSVLANECSAFIQK